LAVLLEVFKKPLEEVGLDNDAQEKLVKAAHETCPYSKATHGNIVRIQRLLCPSATLRALSATPRINDLPFVLAGG
jgi:hypothetical protein